MNFFRPVHEYFSELLNVHELFFMSFSLGRLFFFFLIRPPPHKFSNYSSLSEIKMTGMLLNVGHLQVHKNISQGRLTGF